VHHYANIFVNPGETLSLDDFAQQLFAMLGISNSKRHFDRDDHVYFEGSAAGIEFRVASFSPLPDYPFWVSFGLDESAQAAEYLIDHAKILAWRFARAGWRSFIPRGEARRVANENDGVAYAI